MKLMFLGIVLFLSFAPTFSIAQLDGTSVDQPSTSLTGVQRAFVGSCRGDGKETQLLLSVFTAMNRHDQKQANLALSELNATAAPGGKWKNRRLRRCYEKVLKRLEGRGTQRTKQVEETIRGDTAKSTVNKKTR